MLEHNAELFCRLSHIVGEVSSRESTVEKFGDPRAIGQALQDLATEARKTRLNSVFSQIQRIVAHMGERQKTQPAIFIAEFQNMLLELYRRMQDEFKDRIYLSIDSSDIELYKQSDPCPFGGKVAERFPDMCEDISEAAKCLALERYTACVFHLMRIMELAVRSLGAKVGLIDVDDKKWGSIEKSIREYIDSLLPLSTEKAAYGEMLTLLSMVRIAWRNEVMHPKQTYTNEEARRVYRSVNDFICDLAGLI